MNEQLYQRGMNVYMDRMRRFTTPTGLDVPGMDADTKTMSREDKTALGYFIVWNAEHPEDFRKFVESEASKLPEEVMPETEEQERKFSSNVKPLSDEWRRVTRGNRS